MYRDVKGMLNDVCVVPVVFVVYRLLFARVEATVRQRRVSWSVCIVEMIRLTARVREISIISQARDTFRREKKAQFSLCHWYSRRYTYALFDEAIRL